MKLFCCIAYTNNLETEIWADFAKSYVSKLLKKYLNLCVVYIYFVSLKIKTDLL